MAKARWHLHEFTQYEKDFLDIRLNDYGNCGCEARTAAKEVARCKTLFCRVSIRAASPIELAIKAHRAPAEPGGNAGGVKRISCVGPENQRPWE